MPRDSLVWCFPGPGTFIIHLAESKVAYMRGRGASLYDGDTLVRVSKGRTAVLGTGDHLQA
eukprot:5598234-Amphidinium_carterae.1